LGQKPLVVGRLLQPLLLDGSQHQYRIVAGVLPELTVKLAEEIYGLQVPGPPEVIGQFPQAF
jgi:hypothetical protein